MRTHAGLIRIAFTFAVLLASLSLVVWRQGRAYALLRELDAVRSARAIEEAQRADLNRRIQMLESRGRVVADAQARLGLRVPTADEIVILPLGSTTLPESSSEAKLAAGDDGTRMVTP